MGLRINTNVASLNAQRNLQSTSRALGRSLERLSSGSRINRAGDDAAGLAISEGLQSQVRGLRQAVRNANDSLGFLNTAEGALGEITNITQRLRELAIQAANGAIGNNERRFLNEEMQALLQEFDRIAVQTEFNGTKLLDGSFVETDLQVGVNKGESISFTIGDARASSLGALASLSGQQNRINDDAMGNEITLGTGNRQASVTLSENNGFDTSSPDNSARDYSAIAVAAAINSIANVTGVQASVKESVFQLNNLSLYSLGQTEAVVSGDLTINGQEIVGSVGSIDGLVNTINNFSSVTGVEARLNGSNSVELFARDGRNIQFVVGEQTTGLSVGSFSNGFRAAFNHADNEVNDANLNRIFTAGSYFSFGGADRGRAIDLTSVGAVEISSADLILISGDNSADFFGFSETVAVVDKSTSVSSLDISNQASAQNALQNIDATLNQLNELRSRLGAVQNRLESTIRNLGIGLENISSAQSQIRDADIAEETAELTRAQILQQAGIAVLGQANTSAQVALALLQF
ncbi:MAG: flagellin [Bradymonadales bacterium]|nr:MAG: flagellin [Bradymonadales bacterium]